MLKTLKQPYSWLHYSANGKETNKINNLQAQLIGGAEQSVEVVANARLAALTDFRFEHRVGNPLVAGETTPSLGADHSSVAAAKVFVHRWCPKTAPHQAIEGQSCRRTGSKRREAHMQPGGRRLSFRRPRRLIGRWIHNGRTARWRSTTRRESGRLRC